MIHKRVALGQFSLKKSFSPMARMGFFVSEDLVPFVNDATNFCFNNAWWMADHARLSYLKKKKRITKILNENGYTDVKFIWNKKSGAKVYIAWNSEHAAVVFTGTELDEGSQDFWTDLNFWPGRSGQGGVVHKGFKKAFDSIWDKLEIVLNDISDRPIWITGHSLGGAFAIHAASRFKANGCYTFGTPRVGSKKFNNTILTPVYRVAKNNDIITRLPPPPIYRHPGDTYFITNDEQVVINPTTAKMTSERLGGDKWWGIAGLLIHLLVFN